MGIDHKEKDPWTGKDRLNENSKKGRGGGTTKSQEVPQNRGQVPMENMKKKGRYASGKRKGKKKPLVKPLRAEQKIIPQTVHFHRGETTFSSAGNVR